jgi:hypothetical protein
MERSIVPRRWLRLGSANAHPTTGRLNERTLHLNSQKNGLDNGVHLNFPANEFQDESVRNVIEEALQINGCAPLITLLHDALNMPDGPVLAFPSTEPKVGRRKARIVYLLQNQIKTLGYDSIHHNRNTQLPLLTASFFRNQHPPRRFETVRSSFEFTLDEIQKLFLSLLECLYRHQVYPSCTGVLSDLPPRQPQSPWVIDSFHYLPLLHH